MGSLSSPPPPPAAANASRIYASFCPKGEPVSNWLESYTLSDNTWRNMGPIPSIPTGHLLKGFAMVSLGPSLYIIGGRLCRKDSSPSREIDLVVRREVLRHDAITGEWSTCAPLLSPRFDFACAICDGRIYVAGGLQCDAAAAAPAARRGMSTAEAYDPVVDRWEALPRMRTLRYKCVGVAWGGQFHVVGGFAQRDRASAEVAFGVDRSSAEAYNTERRVWELRPGMWALDVPPNQVVAVEGRLLSSGDCLNTWKGHVEVYDGKLNMWNMVEGSQLDELSSPPLDRVYLTMASVGTSLYFLAGHNLPGGSVSVVHVFDTSDATWRSFEPIQNGEGEGEGEGETKELCGHCCVVHL